MGTLVAEGIDYDNEEPIVSDDDDNHFLGGAVDAQTMTATGIQDGDKPCVSYSVKKENDSASHVVMPCKKEDVEAKMIQEASKTSSYNGIDYKSIWINNNMPCVVAQITSGKLLKGNSFFMKLNQRIAMMHRLFQFDSMEELNQLSFFDIISPSDLSVFWR